MQKKEATKNLTNMHR